MPKNLKIIHWNCFSFKNKKLEFQKFLIDEQPDIVCLNEIKMNIQNSNHFFGDLEGYLFLVKPRESKPECGGGVAILIREGIDYTQDFRFDRIEKNYQIELIAITIFTNAGPLLVVAHYNPPKAGIAGKVSQDLFLKLDALKEDWVLLGDLNARLGFLNGVDGDDRGLGDILLVNSGTVMNILDNSDTYFQYGGSGHSGLLDLCICSPGPASKVEAFEVLTMSNMNSDHVPISVTLRLPVSVRHCDNIQKPSCHPSQIPIGFIPQDKGRFNFLKADWRSFQLNLPTNPSKETLCDIELLNSFIINGIQTAAEKSIPRIMRKPSPRNRPPLPPEILVLIKARQKARKEWHASLKKVIFGDKTDYKEILNLASLKVKIAIKKHMNNLWEKFLEDVGTNRVSSKPFWKKINSFRTNKTARKIPSLVVDGIPLTGDKEKADIFKEKLKNRFAGANDPLFDERFRIEVETSLLTPYIKEEEPGVLMTQVTMGELEANIQHLRAGTSAGKDCIYNCMLKNLSWDFLEIVLALINLTLKEGKIPESWKESRITMIPKNNLPQTRPIIGLSA